MSKFKEVSDAWQALFDAVAKVRDDPTKVKELDDAWQALFDAEARETIYELVVFRLSLALFAFGGLLCLMWWGF